MKAALPAIAITLTLAACVPAAQTPASTPVPAPVARTAPVPRSPSVPQAQVYDSWADVPQTAGQWRYEVNGNGPIAAFIGAQGASEFVMSCDRPRGVINLARAGTSRSARMMTVRSETATRTFQAAPAEQTNPYLQTSIAANDPLLDAMALSKGRIAVEAEGLPPLYLPTWAEVSRVIEDCR